MFLVFEMHGGPEYATFCMDENGNTLVFDTIEEAQSEADACQDGRVIEV